MLHAGLDLSRKKVDVCLLSQDAEIGDISRFPAPNKLVGYTRQNARPSPARLEAKAKTER